MPDRTAAVDVARLVADHWRQHAMQQGDKLLPWCVMAHPLCMVLAALDGETDPGELGVDPDSPEWHAIRALPCVSRDDGHTTGAP